VVLELRAEDPRKIGPYRLVARLGRGGMGQVFLGRSVAGRLVAVKVIRDDLAEDPEFRARFRREVAAARKVSGLFTAPVVDADLDAPVPFLVTAYIAGLSLADAVSRHGPLPPASVLALGAGLAEGLEAIHSAGVVHRDLKPSNVILAEDGPRVIDFGISRTTDAGPLTGTGLTVGSPGFMSPEQADGGEVGPASDVFSLGTVLAFAAMGEGPFGTGSAAALVYRVVHSPPDLDRVPAQVRPLIERCLAKDPGQRPRPGELLAGLGGIGVWAGWLPAAVMQDLPQPPAWLTPAAGAVDRPSRPVTEVAEVAAVPSAPGDGDGSTTRTAARQHPPASEPGAEPRKRRSAVLAVTLTAVLLAIAGFGAYLFISPGHGPGSVAGPSGNASPRATTKPRRPASPGPTPADMVIKVTAAQDCWVSLTDGTGSPIYQGIVSPGTSMTWTEGKTVQIEVGNPAGIVLTVNGKRQRIDTSNPVTLTLSPPSSR
jgi:eukaryotic-like serine/threonine-protein kinase